MAPPTVLPLSITWTWRVIGEFDTSKLSTGTKYEVVLPLKLNGDTRDGWSTPLTLELEPPQGSKPQPNVVHPGSIPLGEYKDFAFPPFTAQGSGNIRLTATTTQFGNLPSSLLVADARAKIKGTDFRIPLAINVYWEAIGQGDADELNPGSKYEVQLPLTLKGETREGWSQPLSLKTTLPAGQSSPPSKSVNPDDVLLKTYKDFPFPQFTAKGPGTIRLYATTYQGGNLPSSLLVEDQQARIKEV